MTRPNLIAHCGLLIKLRIQPMRPRWPATLAMTKRKAVTNFDETGDGFNRISQYRRRTE